MRYFIELQYHGKHYHGWQVQPNAPTVQGELNEKLSIILRHPIETVGAGRTDTGVHARYFVAHFDHPDNLDERAMHLTHKLNQFLPNDIAIHGITRMHDDAHARFDANSRSYSYFISRGKNVFNRDYSWPLFYPLNLDLMQEAAMLLKSFTDFTTFSKAHTDVKTNNCSITECTWVVNPDQLILHISADRFLRNMVRAIVGTLVEIGRGKMRLSDLPVILKAQNRSLAGESAPAQGLFLEKIQYPYPIS